MGIWRETPARLVDRPIRILRRWSSGDFVTGAPQKLYRHLQDGMRQVGYKVNLGMDKVPKLKSTRALTNIATTKGRIIRESHPLEITIPYSILRLVGAILLLVALAYFFLQPDWQDYFLKFGVDFLQSHILQLIIIAILIIAGIVLLKTPHYFKSRQMSVSIDGEVYRSKLGVGTDLSTRSATTARLSMVSELTLTLGVAVAVSKNIRRNGGRVRIRDPTKKFPRGEFKRVEQDFRKAIHIISHQILPAIVIQKTREQIEQEVTARSSPPPPPPP